MIFTIEYLTCSSKIVGKMLSRLLEFCDQTIEKGANILEKKVNIQIS